MALSAVLAAFMLWTSWASTASTPSLSGGAQGCILLYLVAIIAAWLLAYRLRVEVDGRSLRWQVGIGLLKDSYARSEIQSANLVSTPFSIFPRVRRSGLTRMITIAPGRRGVELVLVDSRRVVLGTNDGEALIAALRATSESPVAQ
jgi:hypothetical protein